MGAASPWMLRALLLAVLTGILSLTLRALAAPVEDAAIPTPTPEAAPPAAMVIEGHAEAAGASERRLSGADLKRLPMTSADDVLRATPGLHPSLHGGRGKAYQYFLRGFDAVHGADLAVSVEGIPLNEPSNVHGNGYLDLHILPMDLLTAARLTPGLWRAQDGNFAVAGSAELSLGLPTPGAFARVGLGSDLSLRGTAAWRPTDGGPEDFVLAEAEGGEGVGSGRRYRQLRAAAGAGRALGVGEARAFVLAYDGVFESPGVVRVGDIADGSMELLGAYPGSGGGRSSRVILGTEVRVGSEGRGARLSAWLGWRGLSLRQNYTGFYVDPVHGDGTLQTHESRSGGLRGIRARALSPTLGLEVGADVEGDSFTQSEDAIDVSGAPWAQTFAATGLQGHGGVWSALSWRPRPWLHLTPGLRLDAFGIALTPTLQEGQAVAPERAVAWAPVLAPRLRIAATPKAALTAFAAFGRGMRSPEARGISDGDRAPVTVTESGETGIRWRPGPALELRVAAFGTLVSGELVFDHIAARFLTGGRTRRVGVDGGVAWRGPGGLTLGADVTASDGRYVASGAPIPYAPRLLGVGTLGYERGFRGGVSLTAGARAWALGRRPLPGGFASTPASVVDLTLQAARGPWAVDLDLGNALNRAYYDGEFYYPSRWDPAEPASDLPAHHVTAGSPRILRVALERRF